MNKIKLPKKHQEALRQSLRQLHDLHPEIARAKAAGIDTSEHEQMHEDLTNRLTAIQQQYGEPTHLQ